MKTRKTKAASRGGSRIAHEMEAAGSGAVAGAAFGSIAGPPGMVTGAVLGGAVAAVVAAVLDNEDSRKVARTRELDREIGITDGEIGASNLAHPPPTIGAFSVGSTGADGATTEPPAEGPIQPL